MKLKLTLATLAASALAANAAVIATTSYETSEGFPNGVVTGGFDVTTGGAQWTAGDAGNYAGAWAGMATEPDGTQSAVIGNAGHWLGIDPTGSAGIGTVSFQWDEFSGSTSGDILVQWTTDAFSPAATWTTAATITQTPGANSGWVQEDIAINQTGDVKIRIILDAGAVNGSSFDVMSVTDFTPVPEPSSLALLGLGGLSLFLRRRK